MSPRRGGGNASSAVSNLAQLKFSQEKRHPSFANMIQVFMGPQDSASALGENSFSLNNSKKKLSQPDVRIKKMSGAISSRDNTTLTVKSPQS